MVDPSLRTRFAQKPHCQVGICAEEELDSDNPSETTISRLVDRPHAALAKQLKQVVTIPRTDQWT
jgi:hypothetical protein